MDEYFGEHELGYLLLTAGAGSFGATSVAFFTHSSRPQTDYGRWAAGGALIGAYFGLLLILVAPIL